MEFWNFLKKCVKKHRQLLNLALLKSLKIEAPFYQIEIPFFQIKILDFIKHKKKKLKIEKKQRQLFKKPYFYSFFYTKI